MIDNKETCSWCSKEDDKANMFLDGDEWYHFTCHDEAVEHIRIKLGL